MMYETAWGVTTPGHLPVAGGVARVDRGDQFTLYEVVPALVEMFKVSDYQTIDVFWTGYRSSLRLYKRVTRQEVALMAANLR